jgi:oligoribonuclease NrnB/cAMP/cGMP phosphodiesterase (DHH superfamily)
MTIIYHSKDLDGWCSGAIGKRKWPNAKLVPFDYGQTLPKIDESENVIMVDVSLPMREMVRLSKSVKSFLWIDHHKSAIDDYNGLHESLKFPAVLEIGKAACELMWEHCFSPEIPKTVQLLGAYDVWRNEDFAYWGAQVMPFQYGMRALVTDASNFPQEAFTNMYNHQDVMKYGIGILAYERQVNEQVCKNSFEAGVGPYTAICVNTHTFNSALFLSVYNPDKHDLMIPFQYNGQDWKFSVYTTKEIDCSQIAKQFSGGGHQKAAGFIYHDISQIWEKLERLKGTFKP